MCAKYFSEFVNKQLLFRKCSHMGKVNDLFVQASVEIVRKLLRNINKHGFKFQILNHKRLFAQIMKYSYSNLKKGHFKIL